MQIIPVVDIADGVVVHAMRGQRARYRPIDSALCPGSDPLRIASALVDYCASPLLYVADLDALVARAPQYRLIERLAAALPGIEIWLDAGFGDALAAHAMASALGALASRSHAYDALADRDRAILSLDRMGSASLDQSGCWSAPELWPRRVIVMTLDRVGSDEGPDLATYRAMRAIAPAEVSLIGAGGVRDEDDLRAAAGVGARAWLVASALHERRIARAARDDTVA
jgi:uncharacterized protein related to proFAR isomerase